MTLTQWFIFFLIVQVVHFAGTWKLYEAAGHKRWEAAVPIYNAIVLMKIINRPTWWTILLFVPVVNLIMFPVVWVETLRSFGKNSTQDTLLGIFTLGLYIYYVNYTQPLNHIPDRELRSKSKAGDTLSSLLFAVVVATVVHTYIMQPFTIPTSSLEKSLLIGDFLFVSKFHYGARTPSTTVALPMVHDTIPIINKRSYLFKPQLPSFRFPGFEKIEKNDIVVFNWPVDTVERFFVPGPRVNKPVDKKSNYVKRCVGTPGDSLSIVDGDVVINGKKLILPERSRPQTAYFVTFDGKTPIDFEYLLRSLDVTDGAGFISERRDTLLISAITERGAEALRKVPGVVSVTKNLDKKSNAQSVVFPKGYTNWTIDNYGPIYIPEQGKTVALKRTSLPFYKKIIEEFEGHDLKVNGEEIRIDGKVATSYTFAQNYYWMMGDNRHRSEDSRYWGFVPENHVVGKPVFIWMSLDPNKGGFDKIRWERMFTTVGGEGEPTSYFKFFLIALGLYFVASYFINKRKAAKE
ncbi:signal peptidase I [Flavobacterium selenitireducens]|uniref:signal peptidase I n=1 Tax=Flavobacterium selenitireducens TaxID=2722704 RepID=UPI00168AF818|nr:signal peptidase I [Flavobacterium selenitireducens]MBD3582477.1 signal peptidase I [Flavobacterium selenitireducens]